MIKFEWNEFSNENKCMNMNTELKINKNECRNRNEYNTWGMKMNACLDGNKGMNQNVQLNSQSKIFEWKIHTQIHAFVTYQKEVNDKCLQSIVISNIQVIWNSKIHFLADNIKDDLSST